MASSGVSAALVIGEPGSGKSRLLVEARGRTRLAHSVEVLGYEPERHVPLAAAAQLLRMLTEVPEHGPRLDALLLDTNEARALDPVRIFEAAHRSLRTLEPTLLVIDDLQWMDDLSYALCHYLVRAARESGRIAVFAATRPGERGIELVDLLPGERVSRMELAPLTLEEGIELASVIDPAMDPAFAGELWANAQDRRFGSRPRTDGWGPPAASRTCSHSACEARPPTRAPCLRSSPSSAARSSPPAPPKSSNGPYGASTPRSPSSSAEALPRRQVELCD